MLPKADLRDAAESVVVPRLDWLKQVVDDFCQIGMSTLVDQCTNAQSLQLCSLVS